MKDYETPTCKRNARFLTSRENCTKQTHKSINKHIRTIWLLTTGNTPATRHKYKMVQRQYTEYQEENGFSLMQENLLVNFIFMLKSTSSPGSLWSIYSIIKKWYKTTHSIDVKNWVLVTRFSSRVPCRSKTLLNTIVQQIWSSSHPTTKVKDSSHSKHSHQEPQ